MAPHQQRVVDEKTELDKKATALSEFIGNNPIFETLDAAEHAGQILAERADRALAEVVETGGLIREEVDRRANVDVTGAPRNEQE